MTVSAHDVADELRRRLGDVDSLRLQKLLYYAQGWHLARTGEPMFAERIEAWVYGPVVATHWADERHGRPKPAPRPVVDAALATLEYVVDRYGSLSGLELMRMTHQEDPWRELSETDDPFAPSNPEITPEALARWFRKDEHYRWYESEVERLRRRGRGPLDPLEWTPELEDAVARAVRGERPG